MALRSAPARTCATPSSARRATSSCACDAAATRRARRHGAPAVWGATSTRRASRIRAEVLVVSQGVVTAAVDCRGRARERVRVVRCSVVLPIANLGALVGAWRGTFCPRTKR
eukprot:1723134-Prymnesium_polylepis.1